MVVACVHVSVKPKHIADFIRETGKNHRASVKERGNLRFDILQMSSDPSQFLLYEAYKTAKAQDAHKKTPHYLKWRDAVAGWMSGPREGIRYRILYL